MGPAAGEDRAPGHDRSAAHDQDHGKRANIEQTSAGAPRLKIA
jgi:hypothetical protein